MTSTCCENGKGIVVVVSERRNEIVIVNGMLSWGKGWGSASSEVGSGNEIEVNENVSGGEEENGWE